MKQLYDSLKQRKRPEDVAEMVLEELQGRLSPQEADVLRKAAKGSLRHRLFQYTSMLQTFVQPVGLERQVATARELFESVRSLPTEQASDPEAVEQFIRAAGEEIRKRFGSSDFKIDRLNHEARRAAGLDISRRRYNKLFRHLVRMEQKLYTLVREQKKRDLTMIGKSGLASKLSWEEFSRDVNSACFIAYYTARSNLRSRFTIFGQTRAYDEIADMLLNRCRIEGDTNWYAIAHVYPSQDVLDQLTDEEKGELLGKWSALLQEIAQLLKETWERSHFDLDTMIVRRGDDSTTWNDMANAWNKARDNWIALLYSLGLEVVLDAFCPGKVLRLMAADVAYWHRLEGGTIHPDTLVWRELPLPWEVFSDEKTCTRDQVEAVCSRFGVDPEQSGWIAPRPRGVVVPYTPTPELVHGVAVGNPFVAKVLKDMGWFSGKPKQPAYPAEKPSH